MLYHLCCGKHRNWPSCEKLTVAVTTVRVGLIYDTIYDTIQYAVNLTSTQLSLLYEAKQKK